MKIMYVSSEISPFSKAGGLGEVMGALPKEIEKLGNTIAVFTPLYGCVDCEKFAITELPNSDLKLRFGTAECLFKLKMAKLPESNINVFFVENKKYFSVFSEIYHPQMSPRHEQEKYVVFAKAVLEYSKLLNFKPDIIHINDWHGSPLLGYLKTHYKDDEFYRNVKNVFSIHNLAYQGCFYDDILEYAQFPKELFGLTTGKKNEIVNWMKAGINLSDFVFTVSPKYAFEIQTEEFGCGVERELQNKDEKIKGILNGVDYTVFNPQTDKNITKNYSFETIDDKKFSKKEICRIFALKDFEKPVFAIISRLVEQKGFDLIMDAVEQLQKLDANFIVLGSGEKKYENFFEKLNVENINIKAQTVYDEGLARKLYAGSDFLLMPSHFEPCGISQMIAMKYGTIPVVRAVGGLDNTVIGYPLNMANGLKFNQYTKEDMLECINLALQVFKNNNDFTELRKNAMNMSFSWAKSAREYMCVYDELQSCCKTSLS